MAERGALFFARKSSWQGWWGCETKRFPGASSILWVTHAFQEPFFRAKKLQGAALPRWKLTEIGWGYSMLEAAFWNVFHVFCDACPFHSMFFCSFFAVFHSFPRCVMETGGLDELFRARKRRREWKAVNKHEKHTKHTWKRYEKSMENIIMNNLEEPSLDELPSLPSQPIWKNGISRNAIFISRNAIFKKIVTWTSAPLPR